MKTSQLPFFIITFLLMASITASGQSRLTEKKLIGEWQMIIDVDEEEIQEELEDESFFAREFAEAITEFAFDILDDIEIIMVFERDGDLKIVVDAYGDTEIEYSDWYINRDGELVIGDDDDDEVWILEDGHLVGYEKKYRGMEKKHVYMKRL